MLRTSRRHQNHRVQFSINNNKNNNKRKSSETIGHVVGLGKDYKDKNIIPGDFVYVFEGETIPGDMIIIDVDNLSPFVLYNNMKYRCFNPINLCKNKDNNSSLINNEGTIIFELPYNFNIFNGYIQLLNGDTITITKDSLAWKGEILKTSWILGIIILIDNNSLGWRKNISTINTLSDNEVKTISLDGIRMAIVSSKLFFNSLNDWIIKGQYNNGNIINFSKLYSKIQSTPKLTTFEDCNLRNYIIAMILYFPLNKWNVIRNALLRHGVNLCYLPQHIKESTNLHYKIVCSFKNNICISLAFDPLDLRLEEACYDFLISDYKKDIDSISFNIIDKHNSYHQYSFYCSKNNNKIEFIWNHIDHIELKGSGITTGNGNGYIEIDKYHIENLHLSSNIRLLIINDMIDIPLNIMKDKLQNAKINVISKVFDNTISSDSLSNKCRKWFFTTNSHLIIDQNTPLNNIIDCIQSFISIKSIISIISDDVSLYIKILQQTYPNTFGLFTIISKEYVNFQISINYQLKSISQLSLLPKPKLSNNYTMNISKLNLSVLSPCILNYLKSGIYKKLNISYNELSSIPVCLLYIDNLQKVNIQGNPFQSVPEVYRHDWKDMKYYLSMIEKQASNWNRCRLLFIGQEGVGKTTLIKSIKTKIHQRTLRNWKSKPDLKITNNIATNGIEIHEDVCTHKDNIQFDIWDFGGQEIFYPTHQFFLSDNAIFLIVFRCDKLDESRIEYWLKTLRWLTNNSSNNLIFLVGTHTDLVTNEQIEYIQNTLSKKYTKQFYRSLQQHIFFVNSVQIEKVHEIYDYIIHIVKQTKFLPIQIPSQWVRLYSFLDTISSSIQIVSRSKFESWCILCSISPGDIKEVGLFLSRTGKIIMLEDSNSKILGNHIILNPQWLANVLASVITFRHQFIKNGILLKQNIIHIFDNYEEQQHKFLIDCLTKFKVLVYIRQYDYYIAPSLLDVKPDKDYLSTWNINNDSIIQGKDYKFLFLPLGYMSQVIGRILLLKNIVLIHSWRYGIYFIYNEKEYIYIELNPLLFSLKVRVLFSNILKKRQIKGISKISYIIESTLSILYNAKDETQVQCFIPCSDCLTLNHLDDKNIHIFSFKECIKEIIKGNRYITCPKSQSNIKLSKIGPDLVFSFVKLIKTHKIEIIKLLGKGGFGSVYLGEYKTKNNKIQVAIKELSHSVEENAVSKFSEFFAEVSFMKQLHHENIVNLYGVRLKPQPAMIMEYLPFGDLSKYLQTVEKSSFTWDQRIIIALDIAKGMEYMDSKQLVHRDLRTENILLYNNNGIIRAKIADFGLSRQLLDESKELGHSIWQYNPPERLKDGIYDIKSDVYSFGICLWEIGSRKIPYQELENNDTYFKHINDEHKEINLFKVKHDIIENGLRPSLSLIDKYTPIIFVNLINNTLLSNPNERPTFNEIVVILGRILA